MKKIVILSLLIFITSCIRIFPCGWTSKYAILDTNVSKNLITGKYTLSLNSRKFLNNNFSSWPINLELLPNDNYEFKNTNEIIKKGKWSFSCDENYGCLLELESITVESMGKNENNQPVVLITLGDPDSCEGLAYEKVE